MKSNWSNRAIDLVLASSLLLASCGGSGAAAPAGVLHKSGSRLRAQITNAGGDVRRFDGWYDSKLDSPCVFALAEDGVSRCIPMASSVAYAAIYTDAACNSAVLVTSVSADLAGQFVAAAAGSSPWARTCGADVETVARQTSGTMLSSWRLGAPQAVPPELYFRDTAGRCMPQPPIAGVTMAYSLEHVAPSELVGVRNTRVEPRGASLAVQIFDHDDGSSLIGSTFDVAAKQECWPSWILGVTDDYRCYAIAPDGLDTTCTPGAPDGCEGDLLVGYIDFCEPPPFTRVGATSCDAADPGQMPMLESDLLGTGRLRLVIAHASDDARPLMVNPSLFQDSGRYRRGPFFDTERQLPCDSVTMDDGTIRCLTEDVLYADVYSDSACSHEIAEGVGQDSCAAHGPIPTPSFAVSGTGGPAHLHGLGAAIPPGTAYYRDDTTDPPSCVGYSLLYGGYELTPTDASVFATMTAEIE